ncbi:MAG: hypothetical protein AABX11_02540 [Nanoarchaeota archaeon]
MPEKDVLIKEKLEHVGLFDYGEFYAYAYNWFKNENYSIVENKYTEKAGGSSRDIEFEWTAGSKLSDYFKSEINFKIVVDGMSDVEVEIDGKKKKMNKGRVRMEFKGVLHRDIAGKYESTGFYMFLRGIYNKYVIPNRVDVMEDKVKDDTRDFKEKLKAFLEMSGKRS